MTTPEVIPQVGELTTLRELLSPGEEATRLALFDLVHLAHLHYKVEILLGDLGTEKGEQAGDL